MTFGSSGQYNHPMTIEAVQSRWFGFRKEVEDLTPRIDEVYRIRKENTITQAIEQDEDQAVVYHTVPRLPSMVINNIQRPSVTGHGKDMVFEIAEAVGEDTVEITLYEVVHSSGGGVISTEIINRENINDMNIHSGGIRNRTTWRWRPTKK